MSVINPVISQVIRPVTQPVSRPPKGGGGGGKLTQQLEAFYQFDDNGDIGNDETGNYDLSKTGLGTPGVTTGKYRTGGGSLQFPASGSAGYYQKTSPPNTFRPRNNKRWTFAIGVYPIDLVDRNICGIWNETGNQRSWRLRQVGSTGFSFDISGDGTATDATAANTDGVAANRWYMIVVTYDGSEIAIHVNNSAAATASHSGGAFNSSAAFYVGGVAGGTSPAAQWQGGTIDNHRIDFAAFWDRELSATKISQLYLNGVWRAYAELNNPAFGYTTLAAAEGSGDAWGEGDVIKTVAAITQDRPGEYVYSSSVTVGAGLIHRDPFQTGNYITGIVISSSENTPTSPASWTGFTDNSTANATLDTNGGLHRLRDDDAAGRAKIDFTGDYLDSTDNETFLIVDQLSRATQGANETNTNLFVNANDGAGTRAYTGLVAKQANINWNAVLTGASEVGTGVDYSTARRLWMYIKKDKVAIWFDGNASPSINRTDTWNVAEGATDSKFGFLSGAAGTSGSSLTFGDFCSGHMTTTT